MSTPKTAPAPETIRHTAVEILSGPEYKIEQDTRTGDTLVDLMLQILEWMIAPFRWLFDAMEGLPDALRWIVVIGLFILLLLLVGHIVYTLTSTLRPSVRKSRFSSALTSRRSISADEFEQLSQEAIGRHDYIAAVRYLFKASLVHLQTLEGRVFSPGLTNWQYVRRYQKSRFVDSLSYFAHVIDASWYGNGVCREQEYLKCSEAYADIRRHSKEGSHANNA